MMESLVRQWQERRLLSALIESEHKKAPSQLRRITVQTTVWLSFVCILFFVFRFFGTPTNREWCWIAGAFILGAVIGAIGIFHGSRDQWPILRKYVDFDRVRQRLSSLES